MEAVADEGTAVSSGVGGLVYAKPTIKKIAPAKPENITAKTGRKVLRELPQKPKELPQKPEVESGFAGNFAGNNLIDDEDLESEDFDFYAKVDSKVWRVETRTYEKQDGTTMLYYNYRKRNSYVNKKGKRIIPYKKGGKRALEHGKEG